MICLGAANDCIGAINGMSCQQGVEGEIVCFTGVADGHITPDEHGWTTASWKAHFAW